MPNMPKQPNDAVLCRDGGVKLKGKVVGVWCDDNNHLFQFALAHGQEPVLTDIFRHTLKAKIGEYLSKAKQGATGTTRRTNRTKRFTRDLRFAPALKLF